MNQAEINPCIIVDDIIRSGTAIEETVELVRSLGVPANLGGGIVHFKHAPNRRRDVKSLVESRALL